MSIFGNRLNDWSKGIRTLNLKPRSIELDLPVVRWELHSHFDSSWLLFFLSESWTRNHGNLWFLTGLNLRELAWFCYWLVRVSAHWFARHVWSLFTFGWLSLSTVQLAIRRLSQSSINIIEDFVRLASLNFFPLTYLWFTHLALSS